jgi:hypothetical protein
VIPGDDTRATLEALLDTVARDRDRRCAELAEEAGSRAAALLAEARVRARRTVAEAVASERRRDREAYRLMQARIDTHHRLQLQRLQKQQLERAWAQLSDALYKRWRQVDSRRLWIEAALKRAGLALQPDHWTIAHPPDWPADERSHTHDWLRDRADVSATFEADDSIRAGLVVRRDQACFDATLDGLLAARHRIEAQLLAELAPEPDGKATS